MIEWEIHGMEVGTAIAHMAAPASSMPCPLMATAAPSLSRRIDEGYFGGAKLGGLKMVLAAIWPGRSTRAKALFNRSLMSAQMQSSGMRFTAS